MVARTNVTSSTVRPMLTAVRKGRLTLTAVSNFFFRTAVTVGLPFRTAVSVSLPFRTSGTKTQNVRGGRYPYMSLYRAPGG